jgi:hypothetical protein
MTRAQIVDAIRALLRSSRATWLLRAHPRAIEALIVI